MRKKDEQEAGERISRRGTLRFAHRGSAEKQKWEGKAGGFFVGHRSCAQPVTER